MEKGLIDWTRSFADVDPKDGYTKIFDMHTGAVVAVADPRSGALKTPEEFNLPEPVKYTPLFAQVVCSKIAGGANVKELCEKESWMPSYAVFCRWSREHKEFNEMLQQAEKDRAENLTDEAVTVARDLYKKDFKKQVDVLAATLLVNQLWLKAGVDKPGKFQPKQKSDTPQVAVQVIIETGIRRTGDPGFNVDETEKLKARAPKPGPSQSQEEPTTIDVDTIEMKNVSQEAEKP